MAGLGQDEARLAAQDPETPGEQAVIGRPVRLLGVDLGVQGLQLALVRRGLRPVEQLERYLRLTCHELHLPLTRWNLRRLRGRCTIATQLGCVMIQPGRRSRGGPWRRP